MQKRRVAVLSLFLISVLLISGCQYSAVGLGNKKTPNYVASDSTYYTEYSRGGKGGIVYNAVLSFCEGRAITAGSYVLAGDLQRCWRVIGCIETNIRSTVTPYKYESDSPYFLREPLDFKQMQSYNNQYVLGTETSTIPCYQTSGSPKTLPQEDFDRAVLLY
ncbi:hypothetical protein HYT57_05475 [Candidatus Woesearchaeota archaeon]|nr:hypothetical protein [Candidatus Woesearchaeota archaeon]